MQQDSFACPYKLNTYFIFKCNQSILNINNFKIFHGDPIIFTIVTARKNDRKDRQTNKLHKPRSTMFQSVNFFINMHVYAAVRNPVNLEI